MEHELKKYSEMIAKRVYPEGDKEKKCIDKFVLMKMKRSALSKQIIQLCNESKAKETVLDTPTESNSPTDKQMESEV
jgi:hypothetical protein